MIYLFNSYICNYNYKCNYCIFFIDGGKKRRKFVKLKCLIGYEFVSLCDVLWFVFMFVKGKLYRLYILVVMFLCLIVNL